MRLFHAAAYLSPFRLRLFCAGRSQSKKAVKSRKEAGAVAPPGLRLTEANREGYCRPGSSASVACRRLDSRVCAKGAFEHQKRRPKGTPHPRRSLSFFGLPIGAPKKESLSHNATQSFFQPCRRSGTSGTEQSRGEAAQPPAHPGQADACKRLEGRSQREKRSRDKQIVFQVLYE